MGNSVSQTIGFYGFLLTFPLGIIGHICSIITYLSKTLRRTSTGFFFLFLALSDTLYVFMSFYDFHKNVLQKYTIVTKELCRFRTFIFSISPCLSSWILVLISFDRLIRVCFPYRQGRICTRKNAFYSIIILFICFFLFTIHVLLPEFGMSTIGGLICGVLRSPVTSYSIFYYNIWPTLLLIIVYIIPCCLMIICLICIYIKLKFQRSLVGLQNRRERVQRQMIILMISSITSFCVSTLPHAIQRIYSQQYGNSSTDLIAINLMIVSLNMNYSCNFYIHCLSSNLFRQTFIQQIKRFYNFLKINNHNIIRPIETVNKPTI